jgi:RimJ/RimL family protein N-acetyltransferase
VDATDVSVDLRATVDDDLGPFVEAQGEPDTRRWLGEVSLAWHQRALRTPGLEHLTIEHDGDIAGFVLLAGVADPSRIVELRRIVTLPHLRGLGIGRATLVRVVDRVFDIHGAHRLWLDVKSGNAGARRVYERVGFRFEGELRDSWPEPDGTFSSLVIMSRLRTDLPAR